MNHLRKFVGTKRRSFQGKKDLTLGLAGLVAENGELSSKALRVIIGPALTSELSLSVRTRPAYNVISRKLNAIKEAQ